MLEKDIKTVDEYATLLRTSDLAGRRIIFKEIQRRNGIVQKTGYGIAIDDSYLIIKIKEMSPKDTVIGAYIDLLDYYGLGIDKKKACEFFGINIQSLNRSIRNLNNIDRFEVRSDSEALIFDYMLFYADISFTAKVIFSFLSKMNRKVGVISMGNKFIGESLHMSSSSVRTYLKELKDKGYIRMYTHGEHNRTIELL